MIRIGVVEDELPARAAVLSHLERYQREKGGDFQIASFADGADLVAAWRHDFDVLFLDIEMERMDGMTAAKSIRALDDSVVIVFITRSHHYAVSGYSVGALSYLVKPVAYSAFAQEMDRCLARLARRERRTILLSTEGEKRRLDVADILYLESRRHNVIVYTTGEAHTTRGPLQALEDELAPLGFFRINVGYLVNLRHVVSVKGPAVALRGGVTLQASRHRKQDFLLALSGYVGDRGQPA
jgi:DNA-binding LytR/AlgR family response regulator